MATEKRLIDANALMAVIKAEECDCEVFPWAITTAPTVDAVEVVRCKDCKHWRGDHPEWFQEPGCGSCVECLMDTKEDFYCAYGERKNNG